MKLVATVILFVMAMSVAATEHDNAQESGDWIVAYQFALYFLEEPEEAPVNSAKQLVKKRFPSFSIVEEFN